MINAGVETAFSDNADFSLLSELKLKVTKFVHKAVINVDEKGTEAAAATGVGISLMSYTEPVVINKAFIFQIRHSDTVLDSKVGVHEHVLFQGRVVDIETAQEGLSEEDE